jgi:hypothetical protein
MKFLISISRYYLTSLCLMIGLGCSTVQPITEPAVPVMPLNPSKVLIHECEKFTIEQNQGYFDREFLFCLDRAWNNIYFLGDEAVINELCEKKVYILEDITKSTYADCLQTELYDVHNSCYKENQAKYLDNMTFDDDE